MFTYIDPISGGMGQLCFNKNATPGRSSDLCVAIGWCSCRSQGPLQRRGPLCVPTPSGPERFQEDEKFERLPLKLEPAAFPAKLKFDANRGGCRRIDRPR